MSERESVERSGEDGEGEQEVMGMRWQCWLLKAREVTITRDFIKKGGNQGSY